MRVLELRSVRGTGGGPEKTILLGAQIANQSGTEVTVCYIRDQRDRVFALDQWAARLDIPYVEIFERNSFDLGAWRQLADLVRERRIDIVHAHEYKTDLLALWLRRRTGVAIVATSHGWTGNSSRERIVYYPLDKRILRWFPKVIAVSSDIKAELVRHGSSPESVEVILNAIDPDLFHRVPARQPEVRRSYGIADGEFVIGAVGRLERQKRFDLLLQAFATVAASRANVRLMIVGDGSLRAELEALRQQLGLEQRCLIVGHKTDIAELHHAFDLLVQSSEYEGTPNAVLEAMAMETPIVATDVGGTSELAQSGVHGIIVPKHDVDGLVRAMLEVIADPAGARARAVAARTRIETVLSFQSRTARLDSIYRELLAPDGREAAARA